MPTPSDPPHSAPPLPQVVYRVGVSGHRPNRLGKADPPLLESQVRGVLQAVQAIAGRCAAAHTEPQAATCRVVSSLAEGADRIVAQVALQLGYILQVPLPFPQAEYEADFSDSASLSDFRDLLAHANAVYTLPYPEPPRPRAAGYRAAADLILRQCDLLLVVWDGAPAAGIGGTPETIDRAIEAGIPVLAVDAGAPHPLRWLSPEIAGEDPLKALATVIEWQLTPSVSVRKIEAEYLGERWPRYVSAFSYTFTRLLGNRDLRFPHTPDYRTAGVEIGSGVLRPFYAWTNALATQYGERSRSAALQLQVLAAVAVLSGLCAIPFEKHLYTLRVLACVELGVTLSLVGIAFVVARQPWHERWLRYRALAEQLRALDLLLPLGEILPHSADAVTSLDTSVQQSFDARFIAAATREAGLAAAQVDGAFLDRQREAIGVVVAGQAAFQASAAERYGTAERTLHGLGLGLFSIAVLLSFYDVARSFRITDFASVWVSTLAALLPALGAAFAGIAAQGEYRRLAARAEAMSRTLEQLEEQLKAQPALSLPGASAIARAAARALDSEVRDWQALVASRKPSLPG